MTTRLCKHTSRCVTPLQDLNIALEAETKQSAYAADPMYGVAVTAVRLSVLFLYRRIFPTPKVGRVTLGFIITCLAWWLVHTITLLLLCLPPQKFWEPQRKGHCFPFVHFFLGITVVEIILDFFVLFIPVSNILGLQMTPQKKVSLCSIFLLGAL